MYGDVASVDMTGGTRIEETALRRRAGRVDYWLGAHHATAGSKERVGGSGAHEKWRRTE